MFQPLKTVNGGKESWLVEGLVCFQGSSIDTLQDKPVK